MRRNSSGVFEKNMSGEGEQRESDSIPARVNSDGTNTEIFGDTVNVILLTEKSSGK